MNVVILHFTFNFDFICGVNVCFHKFLCHLCWWCWRDWRESAVFQETERHSRRGRIVSEGLVVSFRLQIRIHSRGGSADHPEGPVQVLQPDGQHQRRQRRQRRRDAQRSRHRLPHQDLTLFLSSSASITSSVSVPVLMWRSVTLLFFSSKYLAL